MKLGEFLPDIASREAKLVQANQFLSKAYEGGFVDFAKARAGGVMSNVEPLGIEQLYFDWLRTAYAYRRQFIQDLYLLAFDSTEIRTPLLWLKNEVFRKGFDEWKPKFRLKCEDCEKEFQEKIERCDKCGSNNLREPDHDQVKRIDEFRLSCNYFGQSLEEVLKASLDAINIVDDAFLYFNSQYSWIGRKWWIKPVEIREIHPALIEFDLDKNGVPKNSHWLCPIHREEVSTIFGKCRECDVEMVPVMYIYNHRGRRIYLLEQELIHFSKFSPSPTYGYSPLLTVLQKVLTLNGMDRFLYRYFFERKVPTGMILTSTDDPQSLEVERARIEARMMEDPTYIPWVAVSQRTGRGRTDFIRLFHTLQEMDYLPVRNEIRDRVSGIYGVPQIYMNVMEGVGGISGQTQQLKLFSSVIQSDQRMFSEKVFPRMLKLFGITDWKLELRPPEEKVEGQVLTLAQQKVGVAMQMQQMGFQVDLKPECKDIKSLDFVFTKVEGQPGMPGMPQAGGAMGVPEVPTGQASEEEQGLPTGQLPVPATPDTEVEPPKPVTNREHRLENAPYEDIDEEAEGTEDEITDFEDEVYKNR